MNATGPFHGIRVEATARLRPKNQLTVPDRIVRALEATPGDRFVFEIDPAQPGRVSIRVMPRDFAGSLTGVFGTTEEALAFVAGEREAWGE